MLLEKWLLTTSVKETSTLANSGLPYLFGYNAIGQLGDNTVLNENDPSSIGIRSWAQLATGKSHTLGLRSDSYLFTWGVNTLGQLGDQTTVHRSSPVQLGGRFWKSISTKEDSSYGLRNDGLLFAWGDNSAGQLGINDFKTVSLAKSWTSISTGASHVLAIRSDGMLFTWGLNTGGRLGTNDILHRSSQVQIGTSSWVYVSAGVDHSTAIRSDGTLFVWGDNTSGRLGDNSILNRSSPVQVGTSSWTLLTAGGIQTAGITTDNQLYVWGTGASGQIGNGSLLNRSQPVQITSLLGETSIEQYAATSGIDPYPYNWTEVESGSLGTASFAIQDDGTLWGWGSNSSGQLGINSTDNKSSPVLVSSESWTQIKSNYEFTIGLRSDGSLWTWGNNANGQLGFEDLVHRSSPVQVGTSSWSQIYAGENASYAIRTDGGLFTWGYNVGGILGNESTASRSSPVQVGTSSWAQISAGTRLAAGLTTSGLLFSWGVNTNAGLGDGSTADKLSPVQITTLLSDESQTSYIATLESPVTLLSWTQVSAGDSHTLAIRSDGRLFAWGDNTNGQLGDNTVFSKSSPAVIGTRSWIAISAYASSAAIRSDNLLFTWGLGTSGQLGTDDTVSRSSPVQIGLNNWSKIAAGFYRFYGILTDGSLYAWGTNNTGSLGDSTTINKSSPIQIGTSSWVAVAGTISSVFDTAIGIRSDGALFTWGDNATGVIGQGGLINRSSPVQVTSLTNQIAEQSYATAIGYTITNYSWTQISVGIRHTVAIRSDGMLFAWGTNLTGGLGNNSTVSVSSPAPIGTSSWTKVSAGDDFTVALRIDGAIFAWGDNASGELGQDDRILRSSPVQVGTNSWSQISAGNGNFFALSAANKLFSVGFNTNGELGQGDTVNRSSPVQIGTNSWTSINAGSTPLAIRSDGLLFAWGASDVGQVGQGGLVNRSSPVQLTSLAGNESAIDSYATTVGYAGTVYYSWTSVASVSSFTMAIRSDGMLFGWGNNNQGQLGTNDTVSVSIPTMIGTSSWTSVYASGRSIVEFTMAIRSDGALFMWGGNPDGQLATNDRVHRSSPVQVGTSSWVQASAGDNWVLARRTDNAMFAWGMSAQGRLGDNTIISRSSPVQIGTSSWIHVDAGANGAALAIRTDKALFTWGDNTYGELGFNDRIHRSSPVQLGTSSWTFASSGFAQILAIRSDGGLFGWGSGDSGRLGTNTVIHRSSPVQVGTSSWSMVATGDQSSYGILTTGALFTWGLGTSGQLGANNLLSKSSPVQVGTSSWSIVSTGKNGGPTVSTAAAIRSDGRLYTWGINQAGQLGNMRLAAVSSPVAVATINDSWNIVAAGGSTLAAIRSDSMLFTWGLGTTGQLGDNTILSKSTPVQIGSSSWISVSGGGTNIVSFLALQNDNALFAWGAGTGGQIGNGTSVNRSSPVQIGTSSWSMVSAYYTSSAIRSDGMLFLWGIGNTGQIGNYRFHNYNSPIQLATMNDSWSSIAAGGRHVAAIRSDKLLYAWGYNFAGPIGDGTTVHRSAPVQIGSSSWISVAASTSATAAIRTDNALYTWGDGSLGVIGDNTININRSSPVQIGSTIDGYYSYDFSSTQYATTTLPASSAAFGTGDFTVECWIYSTAAINTQYICDSRTASSWVLGFSLSAGNGYLQWYSGGAKVSYTGSITLNVWHHIAVVRSGTTITMYVDGVGTTGTDTTDYASTGGLCYLGTRYSQEAAYTFTGKISNFRIVKGTAVYTTDFTPPTSPLTNITNTQLLTLQSSSLKDNSSLNNPVSKAGSLGALPSYNTPFASTPSTAPWSSVSLGTYHASGITADGGLYLWGLGASGQLGNMRPVTQSSPVLVKSVADTWDKISVGVSNIVGIRSDKLLYAWGYNTAGQVGDGTAITRSAPVQIGSSSWANISAGSNHATALKYDGSLFAWGSNTAGQLGLGDLLARSSPVQVGTAVADGYYSTYFDGSGDSLTVGTAASNLSLADFTIEAWVYTTSLNSINAICGSVNSSYSVGFEFTIQTNGSLFFGGQTNNVYVVSLTSSANVITTNTWYHVAFVKNSTQFTMYVNGTSVGTTTSANQWTNQYAISIGILGGIPLSSPFNGYISNFRLVKGSAVYTSDFTPPTAPLTAIANTSLLTCQSSTLIDNSPNNYPVTAGGNAAPSVIQPFNITATGVWYKVSAGNGWTIGLNPDYQIYSWGDNTNGQLGIVRLNNQSSPVIVKGINDSWATASSGGSHNAAIRSDGKLYTWGLGTSGQLGDTTAVTKSTPTLIGASEIPDGFYSVSFNGTSNYLQIAYDTSLKIGTSDFTVEAWVYPTTANKTMCIYTKNGSTGSVSGSFFLGIDTNGKLYYDYNTVVEATSSASIPLNTWTHVAWSRSAGTSYLFINGVLDTSVADTTNCYGTGYIRIGYGRGSNSNYWSGKMSNLRAVNGVGLYTASFTPQGPLTAISNTALLTCQSVTIRDNSINNLTITNN